MTSIRRKNSEFSPFKANLGLFDSIVCISAATREMLRLKSFGWQRLLPVVFFTLFAIPAFAERNEPALELWERNCEMYLLADQPLLSLHQDVYRSGAKFESGELLMFDSEVDFTQGRDYQQAEDAIENTAVNRILQVSSMRNEDYRGRSHLRHNTDIRPNAEISVLDARGRCLFSLGFDMDPALDSAYFTSDSINDN